MVEFSDEPHADLRLPKAVMARFKWVVMDENGVGTELSINEASPPFIDKVPRLYMHFGNHRISAHLTPFELRGIKDALIALVSGYKDLFPPAPVKDADAVEEDAVFGQTVARRFVLPVTLYANLQEIARVRNLTTKDVVVTALEVLVAQEKAKEDSDIDFWKEPEPVRVWDGQTGIECTYVGAPGLAAGAKAQRVIDPRDTAHEVHQAKAYAGALGGKSAAAIPAIGSVVRLKGQPDAPKMTVTGPSREGSGLRCMWWKQSTPIDNAGFEAIDVGAESLDLLE